MKYPLELADLPQRRWVPIEENIDTCPSGAWLRDAA
jgi:hypothetical protein